jgi:hypothetical protein
MPQDSPLSALRISKKAAPILVILVWRQGTWRALFYFKRDVWCPSPFQVSLARHIIVCGLEFALRRAMFVSKPGTRTFGVRQRAWNTRLYLERAVWCLSSSGVLPVRWFVVPGSEFALRRGILVS